MSDERVKRVYAFIKDLLHQGEMFSDIVDIWESAFPLDGEEGTPSLLLPILCCQAAGGDEDQATAIAAAWFLLYLAAKVLDDVEDGDVHQGLWPTFGAPQAINAAVRATARGESWLSPKVATKVMKKALGQEEAEEEATPLTERELEVLWLVAKGRTDRRIG